MMPDPIDPGEAPASPSHSRGDSVMTDQRSAMRDGPSADGDDAVPAYSGEWPDQAVRRMLDHLQQHSLASLVLPELAAAIGVEFDVFLARFPDRAALVRHWMRMVDREVFSIDWRDYAEASIRDRLQDVLLRRFQALDPHREALRRLDRDLLQDPGLALPLIAEQGRSLAGMLEAAGISTAGLGGTLRLAVFTASYLRLRRVFLAAPEQGGLDRLMAEVDQEIARLESLARRFAPRRSAA